MEKRQHHRHKLTVDLEVFDQQSESFIGSIVDLSENGMQLLTDQPLQPRQSCQIQIKPSEFKPLSPHDIEVEVIVCWVHQTNDLDCYRIGCEYLPSPSSTLSVSKKIDYSLGFDPRLYRFSTSS